MDDGHTPLEIMVSTMVLRVAEAAEKTLLAKGHFVPGYRQLKLNMGLSWNRGGSSAPAAEETPVPPRQN